MVVTDACSIYVRRTRDNRPYSLEVLDGATIAPKIDITGRRPMPPDVAYQQVLKGLPAVDYTSDDMIYAPRNPRVNKLYGFSPVEQIIMTVNIALRREIAKLAYYTEGNIPEALVSVPKDWTPGQISEFQSLFDAMMSNPTSRRKMYFVPGDMTFQPSRSSESLGEQIDEWFARVICYAFSLPPLPFVKMMNRATSESSADAAIEEGLQPLMVWFKSILDDIIQRVFGYQDLELIWDDIRKIDPAEQETRDLQLVKVGIKSVDEIRIKMGLDPLGMGPALWGIGPMGVMLVEDFIKASKQGLAMPQIGPPPDAMGGMAGPFGMPPGADGMPADGAPGPTQPVPAAGIQPDLSGISPRVLSAVGLGPQGSGVRHLDVTQADSNASIRRSGAAHPGVLKVLQQAESIHQRQTGGRR